MGMAELAGGRSILFGSGAPEQFTAQSHDMFRMANPRRLEQAEMTSSLKELAGITIPLRLESFQDRTDPKAVWRGIVLGVQSLKSNLSEHNVSYITDDKQLGIAFPEHVEVVTPKGMGNKRQTHMEIVGQRITNTMEHAMLVGLAKKHLERGKTLDMKWLENTFRTTSVAGLKDIMDKDQQSIKKQMGEAWMELAFGKVLQPIKEQAERVKERFVATRQAVTAAMEQAAEKRNKNKARAMAIIGITSIGAPLVLTSCQIAPVTPETPTVPSATDVPTVPTDAVPSVVPSQSPTDAIENGPEKTPETTSSYPQFLAVETVTDLLEKGLSPMPDALKRDPGVQEIITRHTEWIRDAGFNVDNPNAKDYVTVTPVMAPNNTNWFIELTQNGHPLRLKIEDSSSLSGYRWGEFDTYSSDFNPKTDTYTYGLPNLHNQDNHFETIYASGYSILVEVTKDGKPQYWNNIVAKEMQEIMGAEIVVPQELKAGITPEMKYEDCNQLHEDTLTAELTELVAKEHAWLDAQGITADMIIGHGMGDIIQQPLSPYESADFPTASPYLTSCSVLHMNNGTDMFLLGIAIKNNTSDNIAILHFGIDDTGMAFIAKGDPNYTAQYKNYTNSRTFFDKIKTYTTLDEFYHIRPQIFIPLRSSLPEYYEYWPNTVKYMEAYNKEEEATINHYFRAIAMHLDEKAIIKKLETMVIPTREIVPKYP